MSGETMRARGRPGFTLIEVMVAMMVLLIGAAGLVGLANQGNAMNADGRRVTRATAIAQDLLANVELWAYDDPRLANPTTANDTDLGDAAGLFETDAVPLADHGEADLALGGAWLGVPQGELDLGQYQRFWNVAEVDDWNGNGIPDVKRIAVIVRWPMGTTWRRMILYTTKINPAESL
jgi:prepilin-type N-terminal cleavage/methylation domain-containing protein